MPDRLTLRDHSNGGIGGRSERVQVAKALRAEGLTWREIGERMGVGRSTAHELATDPDLSRHYDRRRRHAGVCVDCGAPTDASKGVASRRCAQCAKPVAAERERERARAHRERVERLWADGLTRREIEAVVGSRLNISTLRNHGYNLPHRRSPEQIARIMAGADERLAKARASRKAVVA